MLVVPSPAVEIRSLTMSYAGRTVVDQASWNAPAGAITAVLGPNGAGKTTTIETAEGFRVAQSGHVSVLGLDPIGDRAELTARVGVMLQSGGVWPSLRPRDMLTHVARLHADPQPVAPLLDELGLTHVAGTPYRRLSGGEQQKLGLACTLVGRPELVFLDEPTTGLDPASRIAVWQLLRRAREAGVTVVMTTHLLDEAQALADHVVVIDHGRVAAAGSVAELTTGTPGLRFQARPGLPIPTLAAQLPAGFDVDEPIPGHYRVTGPVDGHIVATVTAWCADAGTMPTELSTTSATLAEAYFELTGPGERA